MKVKGTHAAPALLIVISALSSAANMLKLSDISGDGDVHLTLIVLQLLTMGLPSVFFCLLRGGSYRGSLRLRPPRLRRLSLTVYSLLFIISGSIALSVVMYLLFPETFTGSAIASYAAIADGSGHYGFYAVLTFAIVPAVLEEFLVRGVVNAEYAPYGAGCALVMTSLCFTMLHFNFVRAPIYLFTGVILSLTAGVCNSVIASMIVHTAYNIFVMYFESYIYRIAGKHSGGLILLAFIVVVVMLVSAILFFSKAEHIYYERGANNEASPMVLKKRPAEAGHLVQALISPTFILFAVMYVVLSLLQQ